MEEKLQKLGFSKTEAKIYLYVLSQGRVTPAMVSKDTGIKRPTVYAASANLLNKGIITEDFGGTTKYLVASPKDLEQLITSEKQRIVKDESLVASLLPDLTELARSARSPIPHIQYIRSSDLKEFFYKHIPVWNQSMLDTGETSWWGYSAPDLTQHKFVRDWIHDYWRVTPKKIDLHLFSGENNDEPELQKLGYERRHIKYWGDDNEASQWILGDYIIIVVTKQKPQYAIQIKDKLMAESLRRIYRKMWGLIP